MTDQTVPPETAAGELVKKRADELVVGDRIAERYLPLRCNHAFPAEVIFVRSHRHPHQFLRPGTDPEWWVFVAFAQPDGLHDSTSYRPDAVIEVTPGGPTGQGYSRGDEGDDPQPSARRVPPHLEDGRTGEVVSGLPRLMGPC